MVRRFVWMAWLILAAAVGCGGDDGVGEGGTCYTSDECKSDLLCVAGVCVASNDTGYTCLTDGQCAPGLKCIKGYCAAPGTECTVDIDCPLGQVCQAGACVGTSNECTMDDDCDEGQTCDNGVCIGTGCTTDTDCPGTQVCNQGNCEEPAVTPECVVDGDCHSNNCNELTGQCEDPLTCTSDAQCDDLNNCSVDQCVQNTCTHSAADTNGCCATSADCTAANPCQLMACEDYACVASEKPNCCLSDSDCDDQNSNTIDSCVNNECKYDEAGPCSSDGQCFDGNPCTDDLCEEGNCLFTANMSNSCQCQTNADCAGDKGGACQLMEDGTNSMNYYCTNASGDRMPGEDCVFDFQCYTGVCAQLSSGAVCLGGCLSDSDCSGNSKCGSVNIEMDDATVLEFPACVVPEQNCNGDFDCTGNNLCLPMAGDLENTLKTGCAAPDSPGTTQAGDPCVDDDDCLSGLCVTVPELGQDLCWSACQTDLDCALGLNCYTNRVYFIFDKDTAEPTDDEFYGLNMCIPDIGAWNSCQGDSDCSFDEYCGLYTNTTQTGWDLHCVHAEDTFGSDPGATCISDSNCKSGHCLDVGTQSFCFGVCGNSIDCDILATCTPIEDMVVNDWDDDDPNNDIVDMLTVCLP